MKVKQKHFLLALIYFIAMGSAIISYALLNKHFKDIKRQYQDLLIELTDSLREDIVQLFDMKHNIFSKSKMTEIIQNSTLNTKFGLYTVQLYDIHGTLIYDFSTFSHGTLKPKQKHRFAFANQKKSDVLPSQSEMIRDGKTYYLIHLPNVRKDGYHLSNTLFAFESHPLQKIFNRNNAILFLFYFLTGIIIVLLVQYHKHGIHQTIQDMISYISKEAFGDRKHGRTLDFRKPFTGLSKKISHLIANRIAIEKKYMSMFERYNMLVQHSNDGILTEEIDGTISYCNERLAEILGYEYGVDLIGTNIRELFYDKESRVKYQEETGNRKNAQSSTYRAIFRSRKGRKVICLVSGSVRFDNTGEIIGYYGALTDITSISVYESTLEEIAKRRVNLLQEANIPFIICDKEGMIVDHNDAFSKLITKPSNEIVNQNIANVIRNHDDIYREVYQHLNVTQQTSLEILDPISNQWIFLTVSPILYDALPCMLFMFTNITGLRNQKRFQDLFFQRASAFVFILQGETLLYLSPSFEELTGKDVQYFNMILPSLISQNIDGQRFSYTITNRKFKSLIFNCEQIGKVDRQKIFIGILENA